MIHVSFEDRLTALAEESPKFSDGARVLKTSDALSIILDEIDATVLASQLTFHSDRGALTLLVTGRRMHKITAGASHEVLNHPLDPDDSILTQAAGQALQAFALDVRELRVAHNPVAGDANMSDRVSVQQLSNALGLVSDDPNAAPHERFVTRMEDAFTATIHLVDRGVKEMTGDRMDQTQLKIVLTSQYSAFLNKRRSTCPSHSDPSLTLLADVIEVGTTLGVADYGEHAILFSIPTEKAIVASQSFRTTI